MFNELLILKRVQHTTSNINNTNSSIKVELNEEKKDLVEIQITF